ncbi:MAG: SGNH/GDSL hydrolase family protein [Nitrospinota bacterium]
MKRIGKNLLFAAVVLLGLFVLAEGGQRVRLALGSRPGHWLLYGFQWKSKKRSANLLAYEVHERGGYHVLKGGMRKVEDPGPDSGVKINRLGFRGPQIRRKKSPGVYRIVALGGSSTFGAMSSEEETYPAILQQALHRLSPAGFEVINAGIPGLAPAHLARLLRREIMPLKPDLVVIMSMFNHYFVTTEEGWRRPLIRLRKTLENRSVLFLTLSEKITYFTDPDSLLGRLFVLFADYRGYLEEMIDTAQRGGSRVFLIKQPILQRGARGKNLIPGSTAPEQGWEPRFYRKVLQLVDEVAKAKDVTVVDASTLTGGFSQDLFHDAVHLTPEGNRELAKGVLRAMMEAGILREAEAHGRSDALRLTVTGGRKE